MGTIDSIVANMQYSLQRLKEIRKTSDGNRSSFNSQFDQLINDISYSLASLGGEVSSMQRKQSQMEAVLKWYIKGNLDDHLDEVQEFFKDGG